MAEITEQIAKLATLMRLERVVISGLLRRGRQGDGRQWIVDDNPQKPGHVVDYYLEQFIGKPVRITIQAIDSYNDHSTIRIDWSVDEDEEE